MKRLAPMLFALACVLLGACASGPSRRVSEPSVNIQQLTVRADGSWSVDLRLNNFSNVPMRFDAIELAMTLGGTAAGTLRGRPGLSIGPESADVATVSLVPAPSARIVIADALARGAGIDYRLEGTVDAAPEKAGAHTYRIKRDNALSPVPGISGVLR
jgi:hypothetical protein